MKWLRMHYRKLAEEKRGLAFLKLLPSYRGYSLRHLEHWALPPERIPETKQCAVST